MQKYAFLEKMVLSEVSNLISVGNERASQLQKQQRLEILSKVDVLRIF